MGSPAQIADLVVARPVRDGREVLVGGAGPAGGGAGAGRGGAVDEVPEQDLAVVAARGEQAPPVGGPLDGAEGAAVAAQLQEGLPRLPHVEDADHVGLGREGRQEVRVVGRRGQAQQRGRVRHGLLG